MRPRLKYSAAALLLSIAACNSGDQFRDAEPTNGQDAGDEAPHLLLEAFAAAGEKAVTDGLVEGFQFALVENGEIVGAAGFGLADRETKRGSRG
jgi:CubicO group peptidase (beta-lactamase class C family)